MKKLAKALKKEKFIG